MLKNTLITLYTRDLNKLKEELVLYKKEENIWVIDKDILNSAGNLCLHLIGNLNTYIGAELGGSGYVRNRPEEFSLKGVPRDVLLEKIDQTIVVLTRTFDELTLEQLESEFPQLVLDEMVSTQHLLVHLAMHLNYHLGQINYHRRMLDF